MAESKGNTVTDTPANIDSNTLSEVTCNDGQADMPLDWDASAKDLEKQLNNEMANAAISKMIDKSENNSAPAETRMQDDHNVRETLPVNTELNRVKLDSHVTVGDASRMPLTPAGDKKAPNKAHFIPNATANIPDEETVLEVAETPVRRPSSLINRISGLWTSRPNGGKTQPACASSPEPTLDEAASKDQIASSILDLSRPEIGHQDDKASPKPTQNLDESELDIPAFKRRQAN